MIFYIGIHNLSHTRHFQHAFISINRVRGRKSPLPCADWILDSGAFREIEQFGCYRHSPEIYAREVNRLATISSGMRAAVSQDYMCEPVMIEKTGLTIAEHQHLTIARYDALLPLINPYLMPVLQGYSLHSYLDHIDQYGDRLARGAYVGVGSICKRNGDVRQIEGILSAIHRKRPDLRLHGFGIKWTALGSGIVRDCLHSADSMAWNFAARYEGRDAEDPKEPMRYLDKIKTMPVQLGWKF